MPSWLPNFGQCVDGGLKRLPVDDFGIKTLRAPEAHLFVRRMGGVADGTEVFGIAWRTADVFRRTTTGGLEQEGTSLCRRVVGKRDFPRTLTPAVLMDWPSIGQYRAVQAVAALWKLKGSRSVISASPAR